MYLSEEWLSYERKLGFRPVITGTAEEIRTGYNALSDTIAKQLPLHDPTLTVRMSGLIFSLPYLSAPCSHSLASYALVDLRLWYSK